MIQFGVLNEDDPVELLEGYLVQKMPRNPPHDNCILKTLKRLSTLIPRGWELRVQSAVTLSESEPEPDFAVVRGDETSFAARHPGPNDIGLIIEVAESSLAGDRDDKGRVYAQDRIPWYMIVNLVDRQVELYSNPSGPAAKPGYHSQVVFGPNDRVPLTLDGAVVGSLLVSELIP